MQKPIYKTKSKMVRSLTVPQTSVYETLDTSARRYPKKNAIHYYGADMSYAELQRQVDALAGYLQELGVQKCDRVAVFMQNAPQFVIAFYAILRADAVVVPINPMNKTEELSYYLEDGGIAVAICGAELLSEIAPLIGRTPLRTVVATAYRDYVGETIETQLPDVVMLDMPDELPAGVVDLKAAVAEGREPAPATAGPDDLAVMPYTSGTTGHPKGCMHTHRSILATIVGAGRMKDLDASDVLLGVVPFFHVTGMLNVMADAVNLGAELVIMSRWDRLLAVQLIREREVTAFVNIPTMVIDLLSEPKLRVDDLKVLRHISGGGTNMPEAIHRKLQEVAGLVYQEGYGMTEAAAGTHFNPPDLAKRQCLGIPIFDTEAYVVDPETLMPLPPGTPGEIVVRGPQVFKGYWNDEEKTKASFIEIDSRKFLRTGDMAYVDEDGYFHMVDRLKRMINASGYKVWPAEVEALMYAHPAIQEVCIIASRDPKRGETVKAVIVPRAGAGADADEILAWAKENMSAYKAPRIVEFVRALPKSASGKVQWRELQERELASDPRPGPAPGDRPRVLTDAPLRQRDQP